VISVENTNMEKNQIPNNDSTADEQFSLGIHPYHIMMALILFGITAMFLATTVAYVYTRIEHGLPKLEVPIVFIFNTIILLGSSATLQWAVNAYKKDHTEDYKTALLSTIILSFLFLLCQGYGWKALFSQDIFINSDNAASYLYLISALHFAHVIAGLPFLIQFYFSARKKMIEPVSVLVYFTDPSRRLRLKMITWYWHFLDALWIYLIIFFFVNAYI
jgi:cytochrome c oxidase subunit 3